MLDFWGVWRRVSTDSNERDLVQMGQGLFSSEEIDARVISPQFGMAAVVCPQVGSRQPGIRRLPDGAWLGGAARIDNRVALCDTLRILPSKRDRLSDLELIEQAYLHWGEDCTEHLIGDWSFAVWRPSGHRLFLARDQFGMTGLYYHVCDAYVAFATRRKLLLALDPKLAEVNDLYLAQMLISWRVYHGERTPHRHIRCLPPAHVLTVTDAGAANVRCYWQMASAVTPLPIRSIAEAAEGLLVHFDEAVRCRLDTHEPVAATLSGGLDSGSVTVTAAKMLLAKNRSLTALTGVPLSDDELVFDDNKFGNEWTLAATTASQSPNIRHLPVRSSTTTPLAGIRQSLWILDGPEHAAGNAYWLHDLMRVALTAGNKTLLTGEMGNLGLSWSGASPNTQMKNGPRDWLRAATPPVLLRAMRRQRLIRSVNRAGNSALHPDLVQRVNLIDAASGDPFHPLCSTMSDDALLRRTEILGAGRSNYGALWAEMEAAYGLAVRDPTADIRLLCYCLAVPPHLYVDPVTGMDRMLVRTAMAGRLPDAVRLNRSRGLQAADLVVRLRSDRDAMEACLDELAHSDAIYYVDLPAMRTAWQAVQERDDRKTLRQANAVLLRGIMVGLFVRQPVVGSRPNLDPIPVDEGVL